VPSVVGAIVLVELLVVCLGYDYSLWLTGRSESSYAAVPVLRRPAVWPDAQLLESATVDLASGKLGYRSRT